MIASNPMYNFGNNSKAVNYQILKYEAKLNPEVTYREEVIDPGQALKSKGDFYGLLYELGVSPDLYLMTLVMNNLTSPYAFDGKSFVLKIAVPIN